MGIGSMFKAVILAVICISLLGFATSPAVHQATWDNIVELVPLDEILDQLPGEEEEGDPDPAFFSFRNPQTSHSIRL